MAGSLNKVCLIGNLGKDPEIKTLNSGDRVCSFSMAMTDTWKDKSSGEKKQRTEWMTIVIFNEHIIKVAENYLAKGSKCYVEGSLQTRKYEKDGSDRYTTEVVMQKFAGALLLLGDKGEGGGGGGDRYESHQRDSGTRAQSSGPRENFAADLDDEIPF